MKLTEDELNILKELLTNVGDDKDVIYRKILDDYEKAREWDNLSLDKEDKDIALHGAKLIKQNQNLRELIEKFLERYHNCNPYKGTEDPLFFQDIQKLLEESKK